VSSPLQRLDHILSRCGYCSRRAARDWIREGRVSFNGATAESPEQKTVVASVRVDGEPMECPDGILAILHKPAGYVCSHDAREGPTIYDLLPPRWLRRKPPVTSVGRLDKDATGLLLVTDMGVLVQRWTSPRHHVAKVYEVTVDGDLGDSLAAVFDSGKLVLDGEAKPCLPAKLDILAPRRARLTITEGRYHQVKRMFASQGFTVTRLHRVRFGGFDLGDLQPGRWRLLPAEEVRRHAV
jgi:16S rRNA pseudouridine516 synthase